MKNNLLLFAINYDTFKVAAKIFGLAQGGETGSPARPHLDLKKHVLIIDYPRSMEDSDGAALVVGEGDRVYPISNLAGKLRWRSVWA